MATGLAVSLPLAKAHPDSVNLVTTPEVAVEGIARNLPDNDKAGREELAAQASDLLALLQPLADAAGSMPSGQVGRTTSSGCWRACAARRPQARSPASRAGGGARPG